MGAPSRRSVSSSPAGCRRAAEFRPLLRPAWRASPMTGRRPHRLRALSPGCRAASCSGFRRLSRPMALGLTAPGTRPTLRPRDRWPPTCPRRCRLPGLRSTSNRRCGWCRRRSHPDAPRRRPSACRARPEAWAGSSTASASCPTSDFPEADPQGPDCTYAWAAIDGACEASASSILATPDDRIAARAERPPTAPGARSVTRSRERGHRDHERVHTRGSIAR
jgi:hypothetical protein